MKFTILQELRENTMIPVIFTFSALRCAPAKTLHNPCKFHAFWGSDTLKVACFGKNVESGDFHVLFGEIT